MPSLQNDYPAAWHDYRRRSRRVLIAMVACMPVGLAGGAFLGVWFDNPVPQFAALLLAAAVVGCFNHRLLNWPCPRCGKPFHRDGPWRNPFARRCESCGLPKQEPHTTVWSRR